MKVSWVEQWKCCRGGATDAGTVERQLFVLLLLLLACWMLLSAAPSAKPIYVFTWLFFKAKTQSAIQSRDPDIIIGSRTERKLFTFFCPLTVLAWLLKCCRLCQMIVVVEFEVVLDAQRSPLHRVLSETQCIVIAIRISEDYSSCISLEYFSSGKLHVITLFN